jgi:type IV pilus assembly protein PilA
MKTKTQTGVTLIELLIVLVVVSIIAAFAIPALRGNIATAQATSAIPLSESLRQQIAKYWAFNGTMPADRTALGLGPATNTASEHVAQISVDQGALIAVMQPTANALVANGTLVMLPVTDLDGNLSWICSPAPAPAGLTIASTTLSVTDIAAEYLPNSCE